MATLRVAQYGGSRQDDHGVDLALEVDGLLRQTATARFQFPVSPQDREDIRWYLEDYLQSPFQPGRQVAARIEGRIREIGQELFPVVFDTSGHPA